MKNKIFRSTIVIAMLVLMSICVHAANTDYEQGTTSGGPYGKLNTTADLYVDRNFGKANTDLKAPSSERPANIALKTTINYKFINGNGHEQVASDTGTTSACAGNVLSQGYSAKSYHTVSGGREWGNWSCSLSCNTN